MMFDLNTALQKIETAQTIQVEVQCKPNMFILLKKLGYSFA